MIDLTRPIASGMPTYPGDPEVRVEPQATHESDGYRVSRLELGSHTGTHVDAPAHTEANGATLGEFTPDDLRFDARVVDCRDVGAGEPIRPTALARNASDLADVSALVFRTGWAEAWGTDRLRDHPYLAPETARRCADAEVAVATDALSPDPSSDDASTDAGGSADVNADTGANTDTSTDVNTSGNDDAGLPAHHALLGAGLPIVENVCNLDALPARDTFELLVCPLKIDADGAPARVLARVS
ncbi:cyclase family protein [Halobellus sp. Atlit-31R]|nr:cyclase family protein [Halobellus sp. Atlit-31R]